MFSLDVCKNASLLKGERNLNAETCVVFEIQPQSLHLLQSSFCQPHAQMILAHVTKGEFSVFKLISSLRCQIFIVLRDWEIHVNI